MRYLQRILFGVLLCCLATAAHAQWPPFLPSLEDQYRQQRDEARRERDEARRIQSLTADSLARVRSVLAATRIADKKLDQMRLARIDSLVKVANGSIGEQSEARQEAEAQAKLSTALIGDLYTSVLSELLRDTALGIGRKKWLKNTRKQIEAFRAGKNFT